MLMAQIVNASSCVCTDTVLTVAAMSLPVDVHSTCLAKMISLEVRGKD
jgi:hypothetical protein